MQSPIRLAFVAALAAFALGACSGGGGMTTPPVDTTGFFPVKAGQVTHGFQDVGVSEGATLDNLLGEEYTSNNSPQFSIFEFGAAANDNGIPLQTDTKTAAGRYALVAYQAVLEHSVFLFQGGIYNAALDGVTAGRPGGVPISTGVPTTGDPVAGTWTGKAIGFEVRNPPNRQTFALTLDQAKARIVKADVSIGLTIDGSNQNMTWAFTNWAGGINDYPDIRAGGEARVDNHFLRHSTRYLGPTGWTGGSIGIQFYGPDRKEAGGTFEFGWNNSDYEVRGGFAAKKDE